MGKFIGTGMIILFLPSFLVATTDDQSDKKDARSREVAERFIKVWLARNLDETMKLVEVPWCHDARKIIKDKEKLQEEFIKSFDRPNVFANAKVHIREIATLEGLRNKKIGPPARDVCLSEVLGKDHRVVFVELENDGRFQPIWIGIRLEKVEAKVVGFVD